MIEVTVRIGDRPIGSLHIECIEANGRQPDSVNYYEATLRHFDNGFVYDPPPPRDRHITFSHRYGDLWPVLVREAIEAMEVLP